MKSGHDSLGCCQVLGVGSDSYRYFSLRTASRSGLGDISRLPVSLKVLLENMLRFEDGQGVTIDDIKAMAVWLEQRRSSQEIAFRPARVLMQDFTGVPAVADLAAMREAMAHLGGDPRQINPLVAIDLVIDHSVMVDEFASATAFQHNVDKEFERNLERYEFLRWAQKSFDHFRVVPPGTGICHQVNLEYLAQCVWTEPDPAGSLPLAFPDTLVGTDSHTTMVNALGVLGWGVGGIEAEAAMLGQPFSMILPEVIGVEITGVMQEGATATDLVLTVTQLLRQYGVVGKFVEFFGNGLDQLTLADRATISNMAPEYGATCGIFPIDQETIRYLQFTGRHPDRIALVEAYAREQGMWRDPDSPAPLFTDTLHLDLSKIESSLAGPRRPQDRVALSGLAASFGHELESTFKVPDSQEAVAVDGTDYTLTHGQVVIAAITSCTNTSNPSALVGAGLLARKARALGLQSKPWVKTSLAPGSQVVTDYLQASGLQDDLNALGFNLVGYGCTTCIGNSGPLPEAIANAIDKGNLVVCSVLSGNRNFEGRINPHTRANYLASPLLCVLYALLGRVDADLTAAIGYSGNGQAVYLSDIWPSNREIQSVIQDSLTPQMFRDRYANVFDGTEQWQSIDTDQSLTYHWNQDSTYVKLPPLFQEFPPTPPPIEDFSGARLLAMLGDSVTTDHISPAGAIKKSSPAGQYLISSQVAVSDFNSYGARRGNHEVMMRGTFANIRIRNELVPGCEGGLTRYIPTGEQLTIYEAAMRYKASGTPLVIVAGKEYGTGSSRDWAAKGTRLLGVRAVIAESFERIHRSNLIGMGVLPLQFQSGSDRRQLALDGSELFDLSGLTDGLRPGSTLNLTIRRADDTRLEVEVLCRLDTLDEVEFYKNGGILHYVLRNMMAA